MYTLSLILLRYTYIDIKFFRILLELWSKYCCIDPCVRTLRLYSYAPSTSALPMAAYSPMLSHLFSPHTLLLYPGDYSMNNLIFRLHDKCCMDTLVTLGIEPRTLALLALRSTYWAMRPMSGRIGAWTQDLRLIRPTLYRLSYTTINGLEFYKIDAVSLTLTVLAVYSHFRMSVSF